MSTRIRPVFVILLAAMLVLPAAVGAWQLRLTNNAFDQQYPAISGTNTVWQDNRNGNWDIYLYDGLTGLTHRLTDEPSDQVHPQISGHRVVWEDYRNSPSQKNNPDIYLYDIQTGNEMMVNSPTPIFGGYECNPAIDDSDGTVVVTWIEKANGISEQGRIFYRYIDGTSGPQQAYQDSNTQTDPWISNQKLVWTDVDLGGVYFRYLLDPTTRVLERMPNESVITGLRSSGDRIVWSQWDTERWCWNIRFCELDLTLTNGTKRWLSANEKWQTDPAIDGDIIVWSDERSGSPDLYLYDLATHKERPLVTADGQQMQTAIDGELVTFTDSRNGNNEIYLASITNTTPLPGVVAIPGGVGVPGDANGDGICEDVNGNGHKDFADIVLYFSQLGWIAATEPVTAFDYNGNGAVDFADIIWLFNHL